MSSADAPHYYTFSDPSNSTVPTDPTDCKSPFFWALLFGFLNNIVTSIAGAIQGFYDLFVSCFNTYVAFELEMTKTICALPRVEIIFLLITVVLLVNSALFWASRFMAIVLPYGTPIKRAIAWSDVAAATAVKAGCCGCGGADEAGRRAKVEHLL